MSEGEQDDRTVYKVLINHEEQYSLWPDELELPLGWRETGKRGSKDECVAYVDEVWTDMRPLSLRKQLDGAADPSRDGGGGLSPDRLD
jgi:MbtH protein